MPPQIGPSGGTGGSALNQASLPEEQKSEVSSAKAKDASSTTAPDKSTGTHEKEEDPKTAAKAAQGSKQHANEYKNHHDVRAQLVQKDLHNEVQDLAKQQAPFSPQIPEYRPMGKKTEDLKPGDQQHADKPVGEAKTAHSVSAPKTQDSAGASRHQKSKPEKPMTKSTAPGAWEFASRAAKLAFDATHAVAKGGTGIVGNIVSDAAEQTKIAVLANRVEELAHRPLSLQGTMMQGKLFEVEHISPEDVDRTGQKERSKHNPREVGDSVQHDRHTINTRGATKSGLESRLTELNGGGPLTPFEKTMIDQWHERVHPGGKKVLVPIMGFTEKDKGVQAYKVVEGDSGLKVINYYDRQGNQLRPTGHDELELTDGLDPVAYAVSRWASGRARFQDPSRGSLEKEESEAIHSTPAPSAETGNTIRGYKPAVSSPAPYVQANRRITIQSQSPPPPEPPPEPVVQPRGNTSSEPAGELRTGESAPVPPPGASSGRKTLPGSLYRPRGPLRRGEPPPERPLPSGFPKKSGTELTPEQVYQANDVGRVGWSMTPEEHLRQWKAANPTVSPTSTETPPISFTTSDGRVMVNEERWIQSGQPGLWGNRAGDQVSFPPPPPSNDE